jgi:hypothetical protein
MIEYKTRKIFDLVLNLNKFVDTELIRCAGKVEKPAPGRS